MTRAAMLQDLPAIDAQRRALAWFVSLEAAHDGRRLLEALARATVLEAVA